MSKPVRAVVCGIFQAEINALPYELRARIEPVFWNSMLHMRPDVLDTLLLRTTRSSEITKPEILVYGDCCPHMDVHSRSLSCVRTQGVNCCEIMLGKERYRELRRQGAFFLMPEWLARWQEVFYHELGLADPLIAQKFMQDSMACLVYIDTGLGPVPRTVLDEVKNHFKLPLSIERPGLYHLEKNIRSALQESDNRKHDGFRRQEPDHS